MCVKGTGTVKLSRIRPFCGKILLDQRLRINDLAVAAGGENAAKLLNLTVPHSGGVSEWFSWLPLPELSRRKRRHYHIAAQYSLMDYNSFPFRKRPLE